MSIVVKTVNTEKAQEALRRCPKEVREYVKALKSALAGTQDLNRKALARVKGLANQVMCPEIETGRFKIRNHPDIPDSRTGELQQVIWIETEEGEGTTVNLEDIWGDIM